MSTLSVFKVTSLKLITSLHHFFPLLLKLILKHTDLKYDIVSLLFSSFNPLVAELFCHKLDLLEIVGFLCTFLQHAVC